uniref:Uncharacterized protein n=1 Tax=Tanacetum cinerariifolium TaxID=118510 RepID=A0A699JQ31_TANCI|nr:hypothetical protein [Tanacetum cinerariifolium]
MRSQEVLAEVPPSPDYVSSLEHSPSPDYMPGPEEPEQALLSSDYVPEPEYQRGSEENLEGDHANYPANGGDNDDDESSDDDDDDVNEDDEVAKEEEEHLDLTNSTALHAIDPISSAKDKEAFETDESAPTPVPSPRRRTARMYIRPQIPMSDTNEALIAEHASAPTSPTPPPQFYSHTAMLLESEARYAREAWSHSMNYSEAVHAKLQAYREQVNTHEIQIQTWDIRIGSLETLALKAREPARIDDPEDVGSS